MTDSTVFAPGDFLKHLQDAGFVRRLPIEREEHFELHRIDLTPLKLRTGRFVPFLVAPALAGRIDVEPGRLAAVMDAVGTLVTRESDDFVVLLVGGSIDKSLASTLAIESPRVVLLDAAAMRSITEERGQLPTGRRLAMALRATVGRLALSPYVTGRPAQDGRFFGRTAIIRRLVGARKGGNALILGNRRIGKTSLMREVRQQLRVQEPKGRAFEISGTSCNSTEDLLLRILEVVDPARADHLQSNPARLAQALPKGHTLIHAAVDRDRAPFVLFIDELDHILQFDSRSGGQPAMALLRAMFSGPENCRVVMAGFRQARAAASDMTNPLYNFPSHIALKPLTREEAFDMIASPLERLEVAVTSELREAIYYETGGYPELLQIMCSRLLHLHEDLGTTPAVQELLHEVFTDDVFEAKMFGAFLASTNAAEQLACYSLIRHARVLGEEPSRIEFGMRQLFEALDVFGEAPMPTHLHSLMYNLECAGTLVEADVKGRFRFAVPHFVQACEAHDLEFLIDRTRAALVSTGGLTAGYAAEPAQRR